MRPEGLPDQFWDKDAGLRTPDLIKSWNELSAFQAQHAKTFENFPEKPEDAGKFYTLPEQLLPEGMTLPEGLTFEPDQQLLEAALPIAHKHKLAPEAFQDLVRGYNAMELARHTEAQKQFTEDGKKLGANAERRRQAVSEGLKAIVGPEKAQFVDANAITSGAVEFFEAILSKFTNQDNVIPLHQRRDETPNPDEKSFGPGERIFSSSMKG
jgi:hypothetical protein